MKRGRAQNTARALGGSEKVAAAESNIGVPAPAYHNGNGQIAYFFPVEMLTVEEFAEKMKVSESTVWNWIKEGYLNPGEYIAFNKTVRFPWGPQLISRMLSISAMMHGRQQVLSDTTFVDTITVTEREATPEPSLRRRVEKVLSQPTLPQKLPLKAKNQGERRGICPLNPDFMGQFLK